MALYLSKGSLKTFWTGAGTKMWQKVRHYTTEAGRIFVNFLRIYRCIYMTYTIHSYSNIYIHKQNILVLIKCVCVGGGGGEEGRCHRFES